MELISKFIEFNREAIFFVYGLAFFLLGFAIAMQTWRHSRLDLARSLKWLAVFGITHGLYEWGDLFIATQREYLSPEVIRWMEYLHSLLLIVSFLCLLQFGISLVKSLEFPMWLRPLRRYWPVLQATLIIVWLGSVAYVGYHLPGTDINAVTNALGRYLLAFPGALLSALGLRMQAQQRIASLKVRSIARNLQVAGLSLCLYAFLAGLIPPRVPFFPGNWLNTGAFREVVGVPVVVFRSLLAIAILISITRALEIFDVEIMRTIESMEQKQVLISERERIGRELHDGAIQKIYTAGLLVESAYRSSEPEGLVPTRLERAMVLIQDTIRDMRHNLGELYPAPPAAPFSEQIKQLVADPHLNSLLIIELKMEFDAGEPASALRIHHIMAIVNEALSNIARHAQASHVLIHASSAGNELNLRIEDDGIGVKNIDHTGFGLRNMRDRARLLGGQIELMNCESHGARLQLSIPLNEEG